MMCFCVVGFRSSVLDESSYLNRYVRVVPNLERIASVFGNLHGSVDAAIFAAEVVADIIRCSKAKVYACGRRGIGSIDGNAFSGS